MKKRAPKNTQFEKDFTIVFLKLEEALESDPDYGKGAEVIDELEEIRTLRNIVLGTMESPPPLFTITG